MTTEGGGSRPSPRWALLCLLVPPLVLIGTYSESRYSPLGWIAAVIVLVALFGVVVYASRQRMNGPADD